MHIKLSMLVNFPRPIRRHTALAAGPLIQRLSVRPRQVATGTRTAEAGMTTLEAAGFPDYVVSVPPQCVGTTRVPLVVLFHGGGGTGKLAQVLRAEGYPVVTQLGLRPHIGRMAELAFTWRRLVESWKDPEVSTRVGGPYVRTPADTDVVLTLEVVKQMADF